MMDIRVSLSVIPRLAAISNWPTDVFLLGYVDTVGELIFCGRNQCSIASRARSKFPPDCQRSDAPASFLACAHRVTSSPLSTSGRRVEAVPSVP